MATEHDPNPDADPRGRILTATVALLGEVGWGQITTRKVAQRAGVNNALVHYYFGSKSNLLLEAATHVMTEQFVAPLALLADPEVAVSDAISASVEWLEATDLDPVQLHALTEIMVNGLREPALASLSRNMLAEARVALAGRLEQAGHSRSHAEGAAATVLALLDGLLLHRIIDPDVRFDAVPGALATLFRKEQP